MSAHYVCCTLGAQWLSGRVLDSRPRGCGFEPHRRHCLVVLEQHIYPSLVLVQPRKTRPCLTERLLMGRKESNQTKTSAAYIQMHFRLLFIMEANSMNPDQTAPKGAVWSGFILFAT